MEQRHKDYPDETTLSSYEDLLLFTLFSLKSGLPFDLSSLTTGMDGSTAKRNQDIGLRLVKQALSQSGHLRKKHFDNAESFKAYFKDKGHGESKSVSLIQQATENVLTASSQCALINNRSWLSGCKWKSFRFSILLFLRRTIVTSEFDLFLFFTSAATCYILEQVAG